MAKRKSPSRKVANARKRASPEGDVAGIGKQKEPVLGRPPLPDGEALSEGVFWRFRPSEIEMIRQAAKREGRPINTCARLYLTAWAARRLLRD